MNLSIVLSSQRLMKTDPAVIYLSGHSRPLTLPPLPRLLHYQLRLSWIDMYSWIILIGTYVFLDYCITSTDYHYPYPDIDWYVVLDYLDTDLCILGLLNYHLGYYSLPWLFDWLIYMYSLQIPIIVQGHCMVIVNGQGTAYHTKGHLLWRISHWPQLPHTQLRSVNWINLIHSVNPFQNWTVQ